MSYATPCTGTWAWSNHFEPLQDGILRKLTTWLCRYESRHTDLYRLVDRQAQILRKTWVWCGIKQYILVCTGIYWYIRCMWYVQACTSIWVDWRSTNHGQEERCGRSTAQEGSSDETVSQGGSSLIWMTTWDVMVHTSMYWYILVCTLVDRHIIWTIFFSLLTAVNDVPFMGVYACIHPHWKSTSHHEPQDWM